MPQPHYRHHRETIDNVARTLRADKNVLALVVAGSVAHGFAREDADVDIMIVVSGEEYARRHEEKRELYWERESATYPGGYVDGKYVSLDFIREVGRRGGEPARFAFKDAYPVFSRVDGLEEAMREAARYPGEYKEARMRRLYARFLEWSWFHAEGTAKRDPYLLNAAICNLALYGGRAVLAWNEILYPFHKWFLRVLEGAPDKPAGFMTTIREMLDARSPEAVARFSAAVKGFRDWGVADNEWPKVLMAGEDIGCWESEL